MIALNKNRPLPIGLHLTPRSVTMTQLTGQPGRREVYTMAHSELAYDAGATLEDQERETARALRKLITDHHFKGSQVVTCLSSGELFVQNVRLPELPPEEVAKVILWEAEERLPYPVAEAEVRHILAGQIRQDRNLKQEVILLACRREIIRRHIGVLEQAGLSPAAIDVEPCAVLRSLREASSQNSEETRRAYLNLGETATTVMFAEGGRILFLKTIAGGGSHLDEAVAHHLGLDIVEASRMRAAVTTSPELNADDEIHRSVIDAIRGPLESIATELELCLRYYKVTFRGKPLDKMIITGNEASLWIVEFLSDRMGTPCELGDPFGGLAHRSPATHDRPWCWTTALGLSMK